jgi:hypothetical protein
MLIKAVNPEDNSEIVADTNQNVRRCVVTASCHNISCRVNLSENFVAVLQALKVETLETPWSKNIALPTAFLCK